MQKPPLYALRLHLAHCCASPSIGRHLGVAASPDGTPSVVSVPTSNL